MTFFKPQEELVQEGHIQNYSLRDAWVAQTTSLLKVLDKALDMLFTVETGVKVQPLQDLNSDFSPTSEIATNSDLCQLKRKSMVLQLRSDV